MWIVLLPLIYWASYELSSHYLYGDQAHYRKFYSALAGTNLGEVLKLQGAMLGGIEPFFGYTIWLGSNLGVAKDVWISAFNTLLAALMIVSLRRFRAGALFIFLALTNYYFLVLVTAAERLKFSYIVLFLIILSSGWIKAALVLVAPMFHLQTLINYSSILAERLANIRFSRRVRRKTLILLPIIGSVGILAVLATLPTLLPSILLKATWYASKASSQLVEILNLLGLLVIGTVIATHRARFILALAPILVLAAVLGPQRLNMIGVVVFFHFFLKEGKGNRPILLLILAYFSVRSIAYIDMVISQGTGFI